MSESPERPRLLFLCQTVPYPPDGGVWIRTFNVLRLLAADFRIDLLCFERAVSPRDGFTTSEPISDSPLGALVDALMVFPIPQRHSRVRFVLDHTQSVIRGHVFTKYLYQSSHVEQTLRKQLLQRSYALIHVDSLDLVHYLPMLQQLPVICVHHNVESMLLARRARADPSFIRRAYAKYQSMLMRKTERRWCPRVALNVTVSQDDAVELRRIVGGGMYAVVPNGVDTEYFRPSSFASEPSVVFVGGANWFPNHDALKYFCSAILPLLRAKVPRLKAVWVGAASEEDRVHFANTYNVELTGYVRDVRPFVHPAACVIVPLRVGGGSRLKILDAWAMGKAVVSTPVGCEGLSAQSDVNILIAETPEEFAAAVLRVLKDDTLRDHLGRAGRLTVERQYSWSVIGQSMLPLYHNHFLRTT